MIPKDAVKLFAYLDNVDSPVTFTDDMAADDLSLPKKVDEAQARHILCGSVAMSELAGVAPAAVAGKIKMGYKTALLRFFLTFPEVRPTADEGTVVTLSSTDGKIHNLVNVVRGDLVEGSTFGDLVFYPSKVDMNKNIATAVVCVWAADNFANTKLAVTLNGENYGVDLNLKKTTLEAGKVYDVPRTLKLMPKPVVTWVNDEAGSAPFKYSGGEDLTNDWLSCTKGTVSWTANTTGKPRTAKLSFKNGATFELMQIAPADFKGNYAFTTKVFAQAGSFKPAADPSTLDVTFGAPRVTDALADAAGVSHTNNVGIKGLFYGTVLDGCIEIDYAAMTVRLGLFLDTRDGSGQQTTGGYAVYSPGLCTQSATAWGKPWAYNVTEQGNPDYSWMWFPLSADLQTFEYLNRSSADIELQALTQYPDASMNRICGFGVILNSTNVFSAPKLYSNFFQANPKGLPGERFVRK